MNYALPLTFLLVPFGFLSFGLIHDGHHLAILLAAILVLAWQTGNRFVRAFITYAVLWQVFIFIYAMAYKIPKYVINSSLDATLYAFVGGMIYYAVTVSRFKIESFYNIVCVSALIQTAIGLSQYMGFDPVLWTIALFFKAESLLPGHVTGSLGNNNFLAAYLAISLPFFFRPKWWLAVPVIAFLLYASNTTSAVVPAILVSAWFFGDRLSKRERRLAVAGGLLVVIAYACFQHTPFWENPRWQLWMTAVQQILHDTRTTIFGMGPGAGWGQAYPMHNEWLQIFHQYGIIGLSLLAAFVATIPRNNKILFASFLIIAINMFGNYSLHLAPSAFLIIIVAGLMEREAGRVLSHPPEEVKPAARPRKK